MLRRPRRLVPQRESPRRLVPRKPLEEREPVQPRDLPPRDPPLTLATPPNKTVLMLITRAPLPRDPPRRLVPRNLPPRRPLARERLPLAEDELFSYELNI